MPEHGGITSFSEVFESLQDLQTFEPDAFHQDLALEENEENTISNLILILALIYTDIKNLTIFSSLLGSEKPKDSPQIRKDCGEYAGLSIFLLRLRIAIVVELMNIISSKQGRKIIESEDFKIIFKQIPNSHKDSWNNLVSVAKGLEKKENKFYLLKNIRNKISFHYDFKNLGRGYKFKFKNAVGEDQKPFVSLGRNLQSSRFYFSDAAAEGYIRSEIGEEEFQELNNRVADILNDLNYALFSLVKAFIMKRSSLRDYK